MELLEISDIIDTKLSSLDIGISLDEYEKSLYLTSAQTKVYDELIRRFEMDGDLSKSLEPFITEVSLSTPLVRTGVIANSVFFQMPDTLKKVVYESATLSSSDPLLNGEIVKVIVTKLDEVRRKLKSPFREPNYEEILRVVTSLESTDSVAELIQPTNATVATYKIKYIKKVTPIVLENLPTGLEIEGVSLATNSIFNTEELDKVIDFAIALIVKDKSVVKSEV